MRYTARQLVHLAAVVDAGSFTLAAERLGVTQPALSKSIQQLESRVGSALFRRTGQGVEPTQLGRLLAIHGENIIASERKANIEVEDWSRGQKGKILVGALPTFGTYLMPKVISKFLEKHPDVYIKLAASPSSTPPLELIGNFLDIYVGIMNIKNTPPGVVAAPLYEEELALFVRDGHPLLSIEELGVRDLASSKWIGSPSDRLIRQMADAALAEAGLPAIEMALEVELGLPRCCNNTTQRF